MLTVRRPLAAALGALALTGLSLTALAGPPAAKSPSGKSLVIPEAHQKLGTVYHALPGRDRQVFFDSDAPVERIKGQSNQVIGYCIAGKDNPANLKAGEWHLPVKSMRTGNRTRDRHLTEANWLNAPANPDVIFALKEVKDLAAQGEGGKTWTGTLVGEMTINGVTKLISIEKATIASVAGGDDKAAGIKGDLLAIRCKHQVALADFNVKNPNIGSKVADTLALETTLYMSTVKPEDQPSPASESPEKKDGAPDRK
ncbi:MAG: YceI family protein [Phycisphaerales bacterium]